VRYSDQSFRYRVYAGGYADVAEGAYLAGVIEAAGLDADWVQRGGLPPS
jgi:hypothetical protein